MLGWGTKKLRAITLFKSETAKSEEHKKLVRCFFLLVLFEGHIKYYLQGNWTVCVVCTFKVLKKPKGLNLKLKFCPPPLGTPIREGQTIVCPLPLDFLCTPCVAYFCRNTQKLPL